MKRFKNILYAAEFGAIGEAFDLAVDLAVTNKARLTVLMIMEQIPPHLDRLMPDTFRQARITEAEATVEKFRERVAGRLALETRIVEGTPFLEVIREVLRDERDLVVKSVGGDGSGLDRIFGTTDMHLLRKCPCPVWLIKSSGPASVRRIMAAVDFSGLDPSDRDTAEPLNRMILEMGATLAHRKDSEYHIVHAWEAVGEDLITSIRAGFSEEEVSAYLDAVRLEHQHWVDELLRKARDWIGPEVHDAVNPKTHVAKGKARHIIPGLARELDIDLIVMGTVARTGVRGFIMGNTAEDILSKIDCSVLAVKPPGFVTPVSVEE